MLTSSKYDIAIVGMMLSSHGGGMPRSMAQQAKIMSSKGHKVSLYIGDSSRMPFTPDQFYLGEHIDIYVSRSIGFWGFGIIPKTLYMLYKNAKNHDIIHLNGVWNFTTFFGAIISYIKKVPAIISCRSHYGDYHFTRRPILKKILFFTMEKINLKCVYGLHITSDWEKETSWRAVKKAKNIIKIPNPVDLTDFNNPSLRNQSRIKLGLDESMFYVIHLGRTAKQKNLSILVNSFSNCNFNDDAKLLLIGPPEEDEKRKLVRLAKKLGVNKNIIFIDFAKGSERCDWLSAADIFALPSYDDNFCIVAIEAAASGTLCLTSPFVGAIEYLPSSLIKICPLIQKEWDDSIKYHYDNRPQQNIMKEQISYQFSDDMLEKKWCEQYSKMGL